MQFTDLVKLRPYFTVKHHIPGRLRLKFDLAVLSTPEAKRLQQENSLPKGIKDLRINKYARSLIMEYDKQVIDFNLLQQLLHAQDEQAANNILAQIEKNI